MGRAPSCPTEKLVGDVMGSGSKEGSGELIAPLRPCRVAWRCGWTCSPWICQHLAPPLIFPPGNQRSKENLPNLWGKPKAWGQPRFSLLCCCSATQPSAWAPRPDIPKLVAPGGVLPFQRVPLSPAPFPTASPPRLPPSCQIRAPGDSVEHRRGHPGGRRLLHGREIQRHFCPGVGRARPAPATPLYFNLGDPRVGFGGAVGAGSASTNPDAVFCAVSASPPPSLAAWSRGLLSGHAGLLRSLCWRLGQQRQPHPKADCSRP